MLFYKKFGSVFAGWKPKLNQINSFFFSSCSVHFDFTAAFFFLYSFFHFLVSQAHPTLEHQCFSSFIRWIAHAYIYEFIFFNCTWVFFAHEFIGSIDFVHEHSRTVEHPDIHYMLSKQTSKQAKGKVTRNNKAGLKRHLGGQKGPHDISFSDFFVCF